MNKSSYKIGFKAIIFLLFISCSADRNTSQDLIKVNTEGISFSKLPYSPESYVSYRADNIVIDGLLDEESWNNAEWTSSFVDIEGPSMPEPLFNTRAKILWDDDYLYIAAELSEPHIWARLSQRDTVIFYDNDFEVFIDPDGDTHGYYEFEINALNTQWDLLLTRPYRDNGHVLDAWDINGIKSEVNIYGTLNDPSDIDDKWVCELAFPMDVLEEWGDRPQDGDQWRINFSRVNWRTIVKDNKYIKEINPETGKNFPEFNWVWSPQGIINMHAPETWAYLQFSDQQSGIGQAEFALGKDEEIKWNLRKLYYAQRAYAEDLGVYSGNAKLLNSYDYISSYTTLKILLKPGGYEAYIRSPYTDLLWIIDDTGRIYSKNTGK